MRTDKGAKGEADKEPMEGPIRARGQGTIRAKGGVDRGSRGGPDRGPRRGPIELPRGGRREAQGRSKAEGPIFYIKQQKLHCHLNTNLHTFV